LRNDGTSELSQPLRREPLPLGVEGDTAQRERTESRSTHGSEIDEPGARQSRLNVTGPADRDRAERCQVHHFVVERGDRARGSDYQETCLVASGSLRARGALDVPAGTVDEQTFQAGLDPRQLAGDLVA
jgi:hypothetical protein